MPNDAKALGRRVAGYDDARWAAHRFDAVVRDNLAKFSQSNRPRDFLVGTVPPVLVEASPVDAIRGIGMAADDPRANDPRQWQGPNLLGFVLSSCASTWPAEPDALAIVAGAST